MSGLENAGSEVAETKNVRPQIYVESGSEDFSSVRR